METILFGNYYIEDNTKGPIEWFVLERDGSRLLLVSKYVLDLYHYYEKLKSITWENSDMRAWLNTEFLLSAFNKEELKKIQTTKIKNCDYLLNNTNGGNATCDKVFLLSNEEVLKYFPLKDSRICLGTLYAQNKFNTFLDSSLAKDTLYWWLRSIGMNSACALNVNTSGEINSRSVHCGYYGVRPAMWIDLEADGDLYQEEVIKHITLGNYNNESISWRVLKETSDTLLLVSDYGLEAMSYADDYEATWDESNVKKFLNNEFYNSAFSLEEQGLIIGDVRLLTREEVLELFWSRNDRKCAPTKYLLDKGVYVSNENSLYYWIMSSGDVYYNMLVNADGSLNKIGLPKKLVNVIRPVILIKK